ncbi:4187_t:CDS:2 [Ambispora gerdemannii]|uniref:4187_t:CDS:1 n=1 Tax=Ambispora gerdemannii TaxID=144530 RepID=A0A9N8WA49_9GLOM|nr:4187_t:CDS:2 [Ambispora gerdemannii]
MFLSHIFKDNEYAIQWHNNGNTFYDSSSSYPCTDWIDAGTVVSDLLIDWFQIKYMQSRIAIAKATTTEDAKLFQKLRKVQKVSVVILAHKCGIESHNLPVALQDPTIATIFLRELKKDMPALAFQWSDAGFNDVPPMPNCRNEIPGQTKVAFIVNLVAIGAVNWNDTVFSLQNGPPSYGGL